MYRLVGRNLTVEVSERGAELQSVRRNDTGTEYLWQGDAKYWGQRAPMMFPFCGRVQNGRYTCGGKEYPMGVHGFAAGSDFAVESPGDGLLRFRLCDSEESRKIYPFGFELTVEYELRDDVLSVTWSVKNTGDGTLPFTLGAHPGFFVPLEGGRFEDWYLEFGEACRPEQMEISPNGFRTGKKTPCTLENGRILHLSHRLFDVDGIFLEGAARSVTLRSSDSPRRISLTYPDMPYVGFWHCRGEAPYLCIEPWCGMPEVEGESEDLAEKSDLFRLAPNGEKKISLSMRFE